MKFRIFFIALLCGLFVQCKPARKPESVVKANGSSGGLEANCRNLLTEPEEIRILEYASELASESFAGKIGRKFEAIFALTIAWLEQ